MHLFHSRSFLTPMLSCIKKVFPVACFLFIITLGTSCVDQKKLVYFPDQKDTSVILASLPTVAEPFIQANDVLSINVSSLNPSASAIFNVTNIQTNTTNTSFGTQNGYLVDSAGYISFPFLGQVKAKGYTITQFKELLKTAILDKKLLLGPIVTVRQLNYHITLIGEVGRPGIYNIPSEKVNLLEALGQGGDLTPYANRKTVVLIREENGLRQFHRIDLNSSKILTSPYYYLRTNDILYAEPNKTRAVAVSNQGQLIGYGIAAFGILLSLVTFFISINR